MGPRLTIFIICLAFLRSFGTSRALRATSQSSPSPKPQFTSVPVNEYEDMKARADSGSPSPGPQFTSVPVKKYKDIEARADSCSLIRGDEPTHNHLVPLSKMARRSSNDIAEYLSVHVPNLPKSKVDKSSGSIAFTGLPAGEYLERAKVVFSHRAPAWNLAGRIGGDCSGGIARCSLFLHCVGPENEQKCQKPGAPGDACDGVYKVCRSSLSCKNKVCIEGSRLYEKCDAVAKDVQDAIRCSPGFFCEPSARICLTSRKKGEDCTESYPCDDKLVCDANICRTEAEVNSFQNYTWNDGDLKWTRTIDSRGSSGQLKFFVTGVQCDGKYCDDKKLQQNYGNVPAFLSSTAASQKTESLEGHAHDSKASCPTNSLMSRLDCIGDHCAQVRISCSYVAQNFKVVVNDKMETPYVSSGRSGKCQNGYYAQGLSCNSLLCMHIKLHCVRIQFVLPKKQDLQGRCQTTNDCLEHLICDYFVCRSQSQLDRFIPVAFDAKSLWSTPQFNSSSVPQRYFIAGLKCSRFMCSKMKLLVKESDVIRTLETLMVETPSIQSDSYDNDPLATCPRDMLISRVRCSGYLCSSISLECANPIGVFRILSSEVKETEFTKEVTSEVVCPSGYFAQGLYCRKYMIWSCAKIKLRCVAVQKLQEKGAVDKLGVGRACSSGSYSRTRKRQLLHRECTKGLSCFRGRCQKSSLPVTNGSFCGGAFRCGTGLQCDSGVCRPPSYASQFKSVPLVKLNYGWTPLSGSYESGLSLQQEFPVVGMSCLGAYCDLKRLFVKQSDGPPELSDFRSETTFAKSRSYSVREVVCPSNTVVGSVICRGSDCAEVSLGCAFLSPKFRIRNEVTIRTSAFGAGQSQICDAGYYMQGVSLIKGTMALVCVLVEERELHLGNAGSFCYRNPTCSDGLECKALYCREKNEDLSQFRDYETSSKNLLSSVDITKSRQDSGRLKFLIAGMKCLSDGCTSRRLLLHGERLEPEIGETLKEISFSSRSAMCPSTMVVSRVVIDENGRVSLGCAAVRKSLRVFSDDTKTAKSETSAGEELLCPNKYYLQGATCYGSSKKCEEMGLECVLVKSMTSPLRNLNELCDDSNKCVSYLNCDFGVCGSTDRWRSFSNIISSPSDMLLSPEQSAITAHSRSVVQNLFIVGVQCQYTSCGSYRLVFLDNNRRPSLLSLHEVTPSISPKKRSEEASASCPSNTLASNILCSSSAASRDSFVRASFRRDSCDRLSLGCSFVRAGFRVVGTDITETDFYSGGSLEILCPSGYFMQGITCRGISCAEIKLKCVLVQAEGAIAVARDVQLGERCDRTHRFCKASLSCKDWKCRSVGVLGAMDEFCDEEFKCGKDLTCNFGRCRTDTELTLFEDTSQKERLIAYSAPFNGEGMGSSKAQRCLVVGMVLKRDNDSRKWDSERAAIVGKCDKHADLTGTVVETRFTEYKRGWVSCPVSMVVNTIFCRERECSQIALGCSRMNKVFRIFRYSIKLVNSKQYRAECPAGYAMQGVKCKGSTLLKFKRYRERGGLTGYKGSKCSKIVLRCIRVQKIKFAF